MAVAFWVTLGVLIAAIAKLVFWNDDASWGASLILGSAGAIAGGVLSGILFRSSEMPGFDLGSMVLAIAGAVVLLAPYQAVISRRQSAEPKAMRRAA